MGDDTLAQVTINLEKFKKSILNDMDRKFATRDISTIGELFSEIHDQKSMIGALSDRIKKYKKAYQKAVFELVITKLKYNLLKFAKRFKGVRER